MKSPKPVGRLELTWTNKHLRLLAHEDGSYEWVEPSDHRVAEVRLLRDAGRVGEDDESGVPENLLIRGDALHALLSLSALPECQEKYAGKVRLVYIDPPFNTQQSFLQYDDALEHSVWLTMMRDRFLQVRELLAPDGSVWVHLDDSEQHRARCVLDEVFGPENFVSTMVWQKAHSRRNDAAFVSGAHDVIHVYARHRRELRLNRLEADEKTRRNYTNPDDDPRGDWISVPFHAPNVRPNLTYPIVGPDGTEHWPPKGRCWSRTRQEYDRLRAEERIYFGADGSGVPRRKKFWTEETPTLVPWSWWTRGEVGDNQEATAETRALVGSRDGFGHTQARTTPGAGYPYRF